MSSSFEKVTRPLSAAMEMGRPEGEGVAATAGVAERRAGRCSTAAWPHPAPSIPIAMPMNASSRLFMLLQIQAEPGGGSRGLPGGLAGSDCPRHTVAMTEKSVQLLRAALDSISGA